MDEGTGHDSSNQCCHFPANSRGNARFVCNRHDSVVIKKDGEPVAAWIDALCQRIEAGFSGIAEPQGVGEIQAAVQQDRLPDWRSRQAKAI